MELIVQDPALAHIAAFHAQQAVEKSLKALLEYEGKEVPKIHQIARLQALVDKNLQLDIDTVYLLDSLYIEARYPGDLGLLPFGKPTLADAKRFMEFAQKTYKDVCKILGLEPDDYSPSAHS